MYEKREKIKKGCTKTFKHALQKIKKLTFDDESMSETSGRSMLTSTYRTSSRESTGGSV